jgi:hypothetical protein
MGRDQRTRTKHVTAVLSEREVQALLSKLCIDLGFCLVPTEQARLASAPPSDIDEFTRAVFIAEDLDPLTAESNLYHQVRELVARAFVDHVGA